MENSPIKTLFLVAFLLAFGQQTAVAVPATATGSGALALAAVLAPYAPLIIYERRRIARLFDGKITFNNAKVAVAANSVVCRVSTADITERSCDLTFRTNKRTVQGREANEIFATIAAAGVAAEAASGSAVQSISNLVCNIDPGEIRRKAGGGAECTFDTGR